MQFIRSFLFGGIACCAVVFVIGVYLEPLSGDLTRLGAVAERSWGWNVRQTMPAIKARPPDSKESIIVVGDSFSVPNIWQQILENETGHFIKTYTWEAIGSFSCLREQIVQLKKQAPAVKSVILETVEREFIARLNVRHPQAACPVLEMKSAGERLASAASSQPRRTFAAQLPDPIYAAKAIYGEVRTYTKETLVGDAVIVPLRTAQFFSNRRAAWLLYYAGDLEKNKWDTEQIANALRNLKSLSDYTESLGVKLTILVIPDKSTVYSEHFAGRELLIKQYPIWELLDERGISSINLRESFRKRLSSSVDFYLPNDTHLGSEGYQSIAENLAHRLF